MSSPFESPAYRSPHSSIPGAAAPGAPAPGVPAPGVPAAGASAARQRRIPIVYWVLLIGGCVFSLAVGYAIGERITYLRIEQSIVEHNPAYQPTNSDTASV